MQSIPHPDIICGLARNRFIGASDDQWGDKESTWYAIRDAADSIEQSERLERLRRLRSLVIDAHDARNSGHVYDLGERLKEVELGHNFQAESRYVAQLPMEIAYIHFGHSDHMLFGNGRWIDGVYIRDVSDHRGDGMLFTFVANSIVSHPSSGMLTAARLCDASNCATAFVPADEDPRSVLHNTASYRGETMLARTLKLINGAEIALYGLSMLSPLRPMARNWTP